MRSLSIISSTYEIYKKPSKDKETRDLSFDGKFQNTLFSYKFVSEDFVSYEH